MNWTIATWVCGGILIVALITLAIIGYSIMRLAGDLDQKDEDLYGVDRARRS